MVLTTAHAWFHLTLHDLLICLDVRYCAVLRPIKEAHRAAQFSGRCLARDGRAGYAASFQTSKDLVGLVKLERVLFCALVFSSGITNKSLLHARLCECQRPRLKGIRAVWVF